MFKFLLLACLAAVALVDAKDGRIIGGQLIHIRQAPYLMQLRINNQHFCGATLVSDLYVVSAAHCFDGIDAGTVDVVGGATRASEPGVTRWIVKLFTPQAYEPNLKDMDIAVLKLNAPMVGKDIKPIPLCTKYLQKGDTITVSGWGKTHERSGYPDDLSTVTVPIISKKECADAHIGVARTTNSMVCGSVPGVKDACTGDSGGPAITNGELCAVVSWGIGCGRVDFPGVYTGIAEARPFLQAAMSQ